MSIAHLDWSQWYISKTNHRILWRRIFSNGNNHGHHHHHRLRHQSWHHYLPLAHSEEDILFFLAFQNYLSESSGFRALILNCNYVENCYWVQLDSIPPPSSSFSEDTRLLGSFRWKSLKPNVTFHAGIKQTHVHFQDILACRKHALNKSRNPGDVCHFGSVMSCWRVTQTARQQLACKFFRMYTQTSGNDAVRESRDITRWFTHLPGLPERGCWVRYILWSGWFSRSAKCHRWGWGQRSPTETPHHPVLRSPQKWHLRACADSYLGLSEAYKETEAIANLHTEGNWLAWLILLTGLLFNKHLHLSIWLMLLSKDT